MCVNLAMLPDYIFFGELKRDHAPQEASEMLLKGKATLLRTLEGISSDGCMICLPLSL